MKYPRGVTTFDCNGVISVFSHRHGAVVSQLTGTSIAHVDVLPWDVDGTRKVCQIATVQKDSLNTDSWVCRTDKAKQSFFGFQGVVVGDLKSKKLWGGGSVFLIRIHFDYP